MTHRRRAQKSNQEGHWRRMASASETELELLSAHAVPAARVASILYWVAVAMQENAISPKDGSEPSMP